jgi:hypothetical protein
MNSTIYAIRTVEAVLVGFFFGYLVWWMADRVEYARDH